MLPANTPPTPPQGISVVVIPMTQVPSAFFINNWSGDVMHCPTINNNETGCVDMGILPQ
jgi:hypothetical protein